jgi:hypothetical protein
VYFTAFGSDNMDDLLTTVTEEKKISCTPSGHIATCFEPILDNEYGNSGKVIQAGKTVGIISWGTAKKAHVYLGYILKN